MRIVSLLAVTAAMAVAAPAHAQNFSSTPAQFTSLGAQFTSQYDIVTLGTVSGTYTVPQSYNIYNVSFEVGVNANSAATTSGTLSNSITVDSTLYNFLIPYTIAISSSDTITFNPFTATFGNYNFAFNLLSLTSDGSSIAQGVLTANISAVPEPAAWAMMLIGFGGIGFAMRRRKVVRTSVSYA